MVDALEVRKCTGSRLCRGFWAIGLFPARFRNLPPWMSPGRFAGEQNGSPLACSRTKSSTNPTILAYLNRLSDLLWLLGRQLELQAGVDASLRSPEHPGPRWSRAW